MATQNEFLNKTEPLEGSRVASRRSSSVRWWITTMLTGFAFVSYLQRINISVAAKLMGPELHLSNVQMGQIFSSFLIGYAIFQIPGGVFADRHGTRITLTVSALLWGVCTLLTGLVPTAATTSVALSFFALWLVRFLLGCAEATTYPTGALAVHTWILPKDRAFANSLMFAGTSLAAAFAGPFVAWLMLKVGWRGAFFYTAFPAFLIAVLWRVFSTDHPAQHRSVNAAELAQTPLRPQSAGSDRATSSTSELLELLKNRRIVYLCLSYVTEGYLLFIYVFWLYTYLVDVRGFGILKGGFVTALPWICGLLFTPLGGLAADRLAARHGRLVAAKYIISGCYSLSAILLFLAASSKNLFVCIGALTLSVGFMMAAEASFWVSATHLAGEKAGAVSGLMNTAGVLGGVLSTSLVPILVARFSWVVALGSGMVVTLGCVLLWVAIARENGKAGLPNATENLDLAGEVSS